MDFEKFFQKLCVPSKIYLAITIIVCIVAIFNLVPFLVVFVKFAFGFIWAWILNWLCKNKLEWLSWLILLFPLIVFVLGLFELNRLVSSISKVSSNGNGNSNGNGSSNGNGNNQPQVSMYNY